MNIQEQQTYILSYTFLVQQPLSNSPQSWCFWYILCLHCKECVYSFIWTIVYAGTDTKILRTKGALKLQQPPLSTELNMALEVFFHMKLNFVDGTNFDYSFCKSRSRLYKGRDQVVLWCDTQDIFCNHRKCWMF